MGNIVKFLILTLLSVCLYANSVQQQQITEFDKTFANASSQDALKMHNNMRNIYVQSIMKDDDKLKIEALKRLVVSSKAVNQDSTRYETELKTLGVEVPKPVVKKEVVKPTQPKIAEPTQTKKATTQPRLNIKKVNFKDDGVWFDLSRELKKDEINTFTLKGGGVIRHVYDIKGALLGPSQSKNTKLGEIKVNQYNKTTVRVVIVAKNQLDLKQTHEELGYKIEQDSKTATAKTPAKTATTTTTQKSTSTQKSSKQTTAKTASNTKTNTKTTTNTKTNSKTKTATNATTKTSTKTTTKTNATPKTTTKTATTTQSTKNDNAKTQTSVVRKDSKIIVIDAGHGGKDAGAVNGKLYEKKAVLDLSLKIGNELKKRGYKVYYTRTTDKYLKLAERTRVANDKDAHLFISVHANASPSKDRNNALEGIETYFLSPSRSDRSKNVAALENKSDVEEMNYFSKQTFLNLLNQRKIVESNKVAIDVQRGVLGAMKGHFKVRDGGVREAPFWVLVGAQMPAILLEIGYITHPSESKRIFNNAYQARFAVGVSDGVDAYFANLQ